MGMKGHPVKNSPSDPWRPASCISFREATTIIMSSFRILSEVLEALTRKGVNSFLFPSLPTSLPPANGNALEPLLFFT